MAIKTKGDKKPKDEKKAVELKKTQSTVKDEKELNNLIEEAPKEHHRSKDILKRVPISLRGNRQLWAEFQFWCTMNKKSRSDMVEDFVLDILGKNKDDYR